MCIGKGTAKQNKKKKSTVLEKNKRIKGHEALKGKKNNFADFESSR